MNLFSFLLEIFEVIRIGDISFFFFSHRINEEFMNVKLSDLRILTTLGVGGFGRVELVQLSHDQSKAYALKQMKKAQVCLARQKS
jgi:hypothetical protein